MTDHFSQPKQNDAVLGGQVPPTGVVLGGLEGIKQRLSSGVWEQQIAAAANASQYGEAGLNLLLQALIQKESRQLRWAAYGELLQRTEPAIADAVSQYNPYRSFQHLFTFDGSTFGYQNIAFTPDSQQLVSHNADTLNVWDLNTGKLLLSSQGEGERGIHGFIFCRAIAISPDGQTCYLAYSDNQIRIKHLITGQTIETLQVETLGRYEASLTSIAISPDEQTLLVGTKDDRVKALDLKEKRSRSFDRFERMPHSIEAVKVSPDGQWVLINDTLFSAAGERIRKQDIFCHAVYFSPDGKTIAGVGTKSIVYQWSLQTGDVLNTIELPANAYIRPVGARNDYIPGARSAAFSPDGQTLATTYHSGQIKLWNWQTRNLLHSLEGHGLVYITSTVFSPNGQFLATGANDTIQVWGLPSEAND
ncbi:MAG: hypothetical protein KME45_22370 [Stenomitos rutilans HA7619-LM2]|jgi:WD40 repeat protein|nr:hypothetical protein [Stenomitos rutilans HA7619-LM2]